MIGLTSARIKLEMQVASCLSLVNPIQLGLDNNTHACGICGRSLSQLFGGIGSIEGDGGDRNLGPA